MSDQILKIFINKLQPTNPTAAPNITQPTPPTICCNDLSLIGIAFLI